MSSFNKKYGNFSATICLLYVCLCFPVIAQAVSTPRIKLPLISVNGEINSVQLVGRMMYIGGNFSEVRGLPRIGLAAIDLTDGSIANWNPFLGDGAVVHRLLLSGDKKTLYVAGEFERVYQQETFKNVAKIDINPATSTSGQLIVDWHPYIDGAVKALALSPDERLIYLGGDFLQIEGLARQHLAAMVLQDSQVTPWRPEPDAPVNKLQLSEDGSEIFIAGSFTQIGSSAGRQVRQGLALLYTSNAAALDWNADIADSLGGAAEIFDILPSEDNTILYVAGNFTDAGGVPRRNIAALNMADAAAVSGWDPDADGPVRALALANERLYLGGDFTALNVGAVPRSHLAVLDLADDRILAWSPAIDPVLASGVINTMLVDAVNDELLVGGNFQIIDGSDTHQDMAVFAIAQPVTSAVSIPADTVALQSAFDVELQCLDNTGASCAKIFYTNDGSEPTHNELLPTQTTQVYTIGSPIRINSNTTVKFFAVDDDGNREFIKTREYYVDIDYPETKVTPVEEVINVLRNVPVELRCSDQPIGSGSGCVETLYSTDGSFPSIIYTGPFPLADQETLESTSYILLQYFSKDLAGNEEPIQEHGYFLDIVPPKVTVSNGGGNYVGSLTVTVTCEDKNGCSKLAYTLDGKNPTELEPSPYVAPITLTFSEGTMLRIYAEDVVGNATEGLLGVYTFTSPEREHTRGIGSLAIGWMLLLLPLAWRRLQQ